MRPEATRPATDGPSTHQEPFVERFTRVGPDTIDYRFTVTDPTMDARPWTAAIPMTRTESPLFEYACHEGNYAMTNSLSGTRAEQAAAAAGS